MESMAQVLQRVRDEARRRNVRWTNQRQAIVETFIQTGEHITVEELHRRARQIDPSVSSATVYRTVNMLVEIGVATKRQFGPGSASFECALTKEHHDHLVCLSCGKITEFHQDLIERLQEQVAREHGFQLVHHRLEMFGYCPDCQSQVPVPPEEIEDSTPRS